jgi:hypothetical protein
MIGLNSNNNGRSKNMSSKTLLISHLCSKMAPKEAGEKLFPKWR